MNDVEHRYIPINYALTAMLDGANDYAPWTGACRAATISTPSLNEPAWPQSRIDPRDGNVLTVRCAGRCSSKT